MLREVGVVDIHDVPPASVRLLQMRAQRFALYTDTALVWREGAPAWPNKIPLAPIQIVCVNEGAAPPAHDGMTDLVFVNTKANHIEDAPIDSYIYTGDDKGGFSPARRIDGPSRNASSSAQTNTHTSASRALNPRAPGRL